MKKYYRQDLEARLRQLFQPQRAMPERDTRNPRPFQDRGGRGGNGRGKFQRTPMRENLATLSPRMSASSIVRGARSALPPREALILFALINHPWLLENHAEELVELEFHHPDADRLRRAILEAAADHEAVDTHALRAAIDKRNLGTLLARLETPLSHGADWPARPDAAQEDVRPWWTHVVTLHRKSRSLNKELKDAERALAEDASDANLNWLRDVQGRLTALEGTEATIEGFGALSGRKCVVYEGFWAWRSVSQPGIAKNIFAGASGIVAPDFRGPNLVFAGGICWTQRTLSSHQIPSGMVACR